MAASSEQGKLAFALVNFVGHQVQVQTMTGMVYEGIFHSVDLAPGKDTLGIALRKAYKKATAKAESPFSAEREQPSRDLILNELLISGSDVAQVSAVGVDLGFKPPPPPDVNSDGFTDTGISGGGGEFVERPLQMWTGGDGVSLEGTDNSLESSKRGQHHWSPEEMFKKNAQEHNYKTSWDMDDYTTKIDTSDPAYSKKLREADRLAKEMTQGVGISKSSNPQLLIDRGQNVKGMSEEDMYGSVQRTGSGGANSWVPPHRRPAGAPAPAPAAAAPKQPPAATKPAGGKSRPPGLTTKLPQNRARTPDPLVDRQRQSKGTKVSSVEELKAFGKDLKIGTKDSPAKKDGDDGKEDTSKKALNPNAPAFSFNPGASSFSPAAAKPAVPKVMPQPVHPMPMGGGMPNNMYMQQQRLSNGQFAPPMMQMTPQQQAASGQMRMHPGQMTQQQQQMQMQQMNPQLQQQQMMMNMQRQQMMQMTPQQQQMMMMNMQRQQQMMQMQKQAAQQQQPPQQQQQQQQQPPQLQQQMQMQQPSGDQAPPQ